MINLDPGTLWKHLKTGNMYVIVDVCLLEATLDEHVLYKRADHTGPIWCRPMSEFIDGRFEQVR
jgi:hypothetical protein